MKVELKTTEKIGIAIDVVVIIAFSILCVIHFMGDQGYVALLEVLIVLAVINRMIADSIIRRYRTAFENLKEILDDYIDDLDKKDLTKPE